jgi:hypothetical protein
VNRLNGVSPYATHRMFSAISLARAANVDDHKHSPALPRANRSYRQRHALAAFVANRRALAVLDEPRCEAHLRAEDVNVSVSPPRHGRTSLAMTTEQAISSKQAISSNRNSAYPAIIVVWTPTSRIRSKKVGQVFDTQAGLSNSTPSAAAPSTDSDIAMR